MESRKHPPPERGLFSRRDRILELLPDVQRLLAEEAKSQ
jgi:hypothetical protein